MSIPCWACESPVDPEQVDSSGYVRCGRCGLRFYPSGEAPREQYTEEYFDSFAPEGYLASEPTRRYEAATRLDSFFAEHGVQGGDLLDIGSAGGYFLDEARKRGFRPVGVEPVAAVAERAQRELGLDVRIGFVEDVELPQAAFDVATMWHSLEHIPDPAGVMRAVHAALRPGGKLLLEVPNGVSILALQKGDAWINLQPHVHVGQWTPAAIGALLERTGFRVTLVTTVPSQIYRPHRQGRVLRRAVLAARQRRLLRDTHPTAHELLRAVAIA